MRVFLAGILAACFLGAASCPAAATGTVRVQQGDGTVKIYNDVRISIANDQMSITSNDGKGTLVIGKAACSKIGELIRCLPYDATLEQNGGSAHVALQTGTVWLNPSGTTQPLSHSSAQLPPRGVLMAVRTKAGTYVSLTGTVDELTK